VGSPGRQPNPPPGDSPGEPGLDGRSPRALAAAVERPFPSLRALTPVPPGPVTRCPPRSPPPSAWEGALAPGGEGGRKQNPLAGARPHPGAGWEPACGLRLQTAPKTRG